MIAHKGENIIIGSIIKPVSGEFNLADYTIKCVVTNIRGKTVLEKADADIVRNNADNAVACVFTKDVTSRLKGLYFVSFELYAQSGEKVLSNEVEQLTIVE